MVAVSDRLIVASIGRTGATSERVCCGTDAGTVGVGVGVGVDVDVVDDDDDGDAEEYEAMETEEDCGFKNEVVAFS